MISGDDGGMFWQRFLIFIYIFGLIIGCIEAGGGPVNNDELYRILNVPKTATTKQIRVAFKKLALEKHPDKNQDDPNANEVFIKINRAYEILKDEELRKKYDQYGEEGLKDEHSQNRGYNYQSWNFYKQNFGIYDDDPEIVTLSRSDFMQYVSGESSTVWFINFYSTQCSHCHELAPTWRDLAKQLDGVIRIGAVNCMDDWMLCNEQQIQSFPSLIMYPKRERFNNDKTIDNLIKFAYSFASGNVYDLSGVDKYKKQLDKNINKPWLISYCLNREDEDDEEINYELNCLDELVQRKLAIMLHGLVRVGTINCNKADARQNICPILKPPKSSPLIFYSVLPKLNTDDLNEVKTDYIQTSDYKKIVQVVLTLLPDIKVLDESEFTTILDNLKDKSKREKPWLIQFISEHYPESNQDLELKKLPSLLSTSYNFGRVDCAKLTQIQCSKYQIQKYPTFILFKSVSTIQGGAQIQFTDNWYEIHYGNRQTPEDLASFVKENAQSPVRTLTDFNLRMITDELEINGRDGFFVDFFAPWCPPCMNLLPEFRKASKLDSARSMWFGTVDCTINTRVCEEFNVRSYPTTILFNRTTPHNYHGHHSAHDIGDFIQDILKPTVITLDYNSFINLVGSKPTGKIWLVDFYASWCGPCQQLAPEWRKLAKRVDGKIVQVGQVDCVVEQKLCAEQGVQSYPNIRIYPSNSKGYSRFDQYQGWMRDSNSLLQWVTNYMPSAAHILDWGNFDRLVLKNTDQQPWLIDFYAPWCGHCQVFAPTFEQIATKLEGKVKCGKVNCQEQQYLCQMAGIQAYPTIRFYKLPKTTSLNYNSGFDDIQAYDLSSVLNVINSKMNQYGYNTKPKASKKDNTDL